MSSGRILLSVAGALLLFLMLAILLPARVRIRVRGSGAQFDVAIWVKPPIWPWYIHIPDIGRWLRRPRRARPENQEAPDGADGSDRAGTKRSSATDGSVGGSEGEKASRRATSRASQPDVLDRIRDTFYQFRRLYPPAKDALLTISRAIRFERFRVRGRAGSGDAYETAMFCGAVNSIAGLGVSVLKKGGVRFSETPLVRFSPVFDKLDFALAADVETSFSVAGMLRAMLGLKKVVKMDSFYDIKTRLVRHERLSS